jgi:hypothetical protein
VLQITGKCLEVVSERVEPRPGQTFEAFDSHRFMLLSGKADVVEVRPARAFLVADWPKEGETVTLAVTVEAFNSKGGGGYRLQSSGRIAASVRSVPSAGSASAAS